VHRKKLSLRLPRAKHHSTRPTSRVELALAIKARRGDGTLGPSAQPDVLHDAALYRITQGSGRCGGASGLITSNFLLHPATGEFEERQVTVVFQPEPPGAQIG
jgi:hypothetical protein